MTSDGTAATKARSAPEPDSARKPDSPTDLEAPPLKYSLKQAFGEFGATSAPTSPRP